MNAHAGHGLKLAEDPLLSDKGPTPELGTTFGQNLWQRSRSERSGAPPPSAKCGERPFSSWKFTAYAAAAGSFASGAHAARSHGRGAGVQGLSGRRAAIWSTRETCASAYRRSSVAASR